MLYLFLAAFLVIGGAFAALVHALTGKPRLALAGGVVGFAAFLAFYVYWKSDGGVLRWLGF